MRKPEYLSPSNIRLYFEEPEEWYVRYLSDYKVPRWPQTQPMSIGSAFDAYAKSYLHEILFGKGHDPRFELQTLFEAQVEPHNRDWALVHGKEAFRIYKELGALSDLLLELRDAVGNPRFEIEIRGRVKGIKGPINGIVILGKPDVYFINRAGHSVILDWKVNGWCSKWPTSPAKGYLRLLGDKKKSGHHKDAFPIMFQGMMINANHPLDEVNPEWAAQLATYGWLCGEEVGAEFITAIDQFACSPSGEMYPNVRVAEHRTKVTEAFQKDTYAQYCIVQDVIDTGHVFKDLTIEQSMDKCKMLDSKAQMLLRLHESGTPEDEAFKQLTGMAA